MGPESLRGVVANRLGADRHTLSPAGILAGRADPLMRQAAHLLAEEVEQRTRRRVRQAARPPRTPTGLTVFVGLRSELGHPLPKLPLEQPVQREEKPVAEGSVVQRTPIAVPAEVAEAGNDGLGALFGVGRLLRECRLAVQLERHLRALQTGWPEIDVDSPTFPQLVVGRT